MGTYRTEDGYEVSEYRYITDEEAEEEECSSYDIRTGTYPDQTFPVTLLIVAIIVFVVLLCAAVSGAH